MFILELERPDGTPLRLSYDPLASRITQKDGRDLDLSPLGLAYEEGLRFREVRPFGPADGPAKSKRIGRLKIQLGLGCNYRCAYCCQQEGRAAAVGSQGDVARFLAGLPAWMETPPDNQDLRIEFWGGEPFVYWKTLKPLAEGLRARFPRALFSLTTNGSLLDGEKVDWLRALDFQVSLSHDGPGQYLRGPDPLDDRVAGPAIRRLWALLGPAGRMAFHCVLSLAQPSLKAVRDHLAARLGDPRVNVTTEGIVVARHTGGIRLAPATPEDHRLIRARLFADMADPEVFMTGAVQFKLHQFLGLLSTRRPATSLGQRCGMDQETSLAVDLAGNVLLCQNTAAATHRLGSVEDLEAVRLRHSTHWGRREECRHCPVLAFCGGSCMYTEGVEREMSCDAELSQGLALLALALYLPTNARLRAVRGERIRFPGIREILFDAACPLR